MAVLTDDSGLGPDKLTPARTGSSRAGRHWKSCGCRSTCICGCLRGPSAAAFAGCAGRDLPRATGTGGRGPLRPAPLSQLSYRRGNCVERIIRLIGVANDGKSDSVNGVPESRSREWREIDYVPPMSYGRARAFKKKHDLGSASCIEIIGDCPYVE